MTDEEFDSCIDDAMKPEIIPLYCPDCDEEYSLPEDTEVCPFCNSAEIRY